MTPDVRGQLKCDGTGAETRFRLSAKRTSPFKSAGASVQSTIGSRGVRISGSDAGYTMFRGSVKGTGYPLHSPVSPSLPLPCVIVCNHVSTGVYAAKHLLFGILGGTECSIRSGFWCGVLFMDSVTDKTNRVRNYCFVNCGWSILRGSRLASEKVNSNKQDMLFNSADPITALRAP